MRDRHDRAVEAPREQLDPRAALVVEVGLGLVEQQHVRLLLEAGGERDQLALAAREAAGRKRQLVGREPELEQGGARPARGARPAGCLEALERLLLAGEHARHPVEVGDHLGAAELRAELGQLLLELDEIGARVEHGLERRAVVAGRVLVEIGDAGAAAAGDLAAVGSLEAGEDLQQRRLAAAVRPDDADPGLRLDRQVGAVEDEARAERLRDRRGRRAASRRDGAFGGHASRTAGCCDRADAGKLPCHAGNLPLPLKAARCRPIDSSMRRALALIATISSPSASAGVAAGGAARSPTPPLLPPSAPAATLVGRSRRFGPSRRSGSSATISPASGRRIR